MKLKNIYPLLFIALMAMISSCSKDFLELEPKNSRLEENFYKTQEDMYQAMIATYDVLQWGGYKGYVPEESLSDVASDDAYAGGANAGDQPSWVALDQYTLAPTLGPQASIWGRYYRGIYRANIFLEKIDAAESSDDFRKTSIAEVKFLRAYYYFNLVRWFGNVPLILNVLNPSEYNYPQSAPTAIFAQIEQDLNSAIPNLPETQSADMLGRATSGAARSLLAKVILFQDDDTRISEVAELTDAVINSGAYQLMDNFADNFTSEGRNCAESVFEIQHSSNSSWGDWGWLPGGEGNIAIIMNGMRDYNGSSYQAGWGFCPVTESLVDELKDDPRFAATVIDAAEGELGGDGFFNTTIDGQPAKYKPGFQNTGYFNNKYAPLQSNISPDGEPMINFPNNVKVIRYSDVLLMSAEAHARMGDDANAAMNLNQVRQRVGLDDVSAGGAELLDAIYKERRLELALEGHRYWDLIRTKRAVQILGPLGWVDGKNNYLPIPQSEIDNTNSTIKQNPGY